MQTICRPGCKPRVALFPTGSPGPSQNKQEEGADSGAPIEPEGGLKEVA